MVAERPHDGDIAVETDHRHGEDRRERGRYEEADPQQAVVHAVHLVGREPDHGLEQSRRPHLVRCINKKVLSDVPIPLFAKTGTDTYRIYVLGSFVLFIRNTTRFMGPLRAKSSVT